MSQSSQTPNHRVEARKANHAEEWTSWLIQFIK